MTTGIFGLALPYDTPSDGFLTRTGGDLREMICRGAITPAALNAECSFQLDHRRDKILCGTRLTLFNTRVGVYFCAHVPTSSPVLREALDARGHGTECRSHMTARGPSASLIGLLVRGK